MADSVENIEISAEENLISRQKKERKELQSQIAKLKHAVPKGDKKAKKEMTTKVALLEAQLDEKHKNELAELESSKSVSETSDRVATLSLKDVPSENGLNVENDTGNTQKKPSKAQRRRAKKAAGNKAREELIAQQEIENLTGARNIEAVKLKKLLTAKNLKILEVPSDGNCLYAALVCQLQNRGIKTSVQLLRKQTARHMRGNQDDFMPFLSKPDTGEPYSEEEFEAYCKEVESTPAWGGQLEINAISNILELPIEVIQADVPSIMTGEEYKAPPLILTYHRHMLGLGEHYNAVTNRTPEDEEDEFS